jgi:hypothetical protein
VTTIPPVVATFIPLVYVNTGESYVNIFRPVPTSAEISTLEWRATPFALGTRRHLIWLPEFQTTVAHAVSPSLTTPDRLSTPKFVPVTVTYTPPEPAAFVSATLVTAGLSYVNTKDCEPTILLAVTAAECCMPAPTASVQLRAVSVTHFEVVQAEAPTLAVNDKSLNP